MLSSARQTLTESWTLPPKSVVAFWELPCRPFVGDDGPMPIISEPRPNLMLRLGITIAERVTGRRMTPARLLAWAPRTALGAGVLEATAAHAGHGLSARTLKLVRMTVSLAVNCPFCIDMNSTGHRAAGITDQEVLAIRDGRESDLASFSAHERVAIAWARGASATPVALGDELLASVAATFTERQVVILAATIAQVNYWARLIQSLGVPPAGFGDHCLLPQTNL